VVTQVALRAGIHFTKWMPDAGGVRERPNRHDWKSCEGKPSVGSNPTSSATSHLTSQLQHQSVAARSKMSGPIVNCVLGKRHCPFFQISDHSIRRVD
jgi:hypothetical protein